MSKFTISIILIFTGLIANSIYIIHQDINTNKEKAKQQKRILDFEKSSKFKIKQTQKTKGFVKDYYFINNIKS